MFKTVKNYLVTTPALLAVALVGNSLYSNSASANETVNVDTTLEQIQNYDKMTPMGQVNSVGQLRDVSPTDWAFEALRSLVERYGCIVGYPDRTFRGNRALSRYEFAAGLNACMQQMERLIASSQTVVAEDLETLKRLMKEFENELAMLGARVDNLEARVAFLEDHQFSTTTKLRGEVVVAAQASTGPDEKLNQFYRVPGGVNSEIFGISSNGVPGIGLNPSELGDLADDYLNELDTLNDELAAGNLTQEEYDDAVNDLNDQFDDDVQGEVDDIDDVDDQVTLSNRVRLTLDSSFTGKDRLRLRLAAGNGPSLGSAYGTDQARLNFEQDTGNDVVIDRAYYRTGIGPATLFIGTAMPVEDIYDTYSPYTESSGTGSLSRALRYNPFIYRAPGDAGIGLKLGTDWVNVTASYLAGNASNPSEGAGLFDGTYSAGVQLGFNPFEAFGISVAYMHTYFNGQRDGISADTASRANLSGGLGSDYTSGVSNSIALLGGGGGFRGARDPFSGAATSADNLGIQGNWNLGFMNIAAWGGWSNATAKSHDSTGADRDGDSTELWTWGTNISFLDLFAEGAVLNLGGGQLPRAGYVDGTFGRDKNQSWIVEGNYQFPVTNNITITPGAYAIFNPNNDADNDTIIVGVIRTVFKF